MLLSAERGELTDTDTDAETQCIRRTVVGQGRRMRCYKPAPCSLSSCMQNRYLPPQCCMAPGDVSVGSGRGVVSLVRRAEFWVLVVAVVVCVGGVGGVSKVAAGLRFSMARSAARRPLCSRYQVPFHASSSAIITQDRTFSGRNSSLCRALPARFVSSLASRWPGLPGCC